MSNYSNEFFEHSLDLLCVVSMDGFFLEVNPSWERVLGWSLSELTSQPFIHFIHPEDIAATMAEVSKVFSGLDAVDFQNRYLTKNGTYKWLSWRARVVAEKKMLLASARDITEQKFLSLELQETKERLSIAITAVKFGVWDWNLKTGLLIWDDYMYQIFGIKKEDFSGAYDAFEKTLLPLDAKRVNQELQDTFLKKNDYYESAFRVKTESSLIRYIKASAKCFYDSEGKIERLVGVNWDDTERRESETKLISSAKMASLGEMAGGIAHEINNPLAIIYGKINLLKKQAEAEPIDLKKVKEDLIKIEQTTNRITKIIRGLRTFSRNSDADPMENTNVSQVIGDTLELCRERFKNHSIPISVSCAADIFLDCRPTQIAQILMNLLNNAFDAVESCEEKWVKVEASSTNALVTLSVIDSGHGIDSTLVAKLMEPFFTTKDIGKGTGLGLSISKGIAEIHHGRLFYDASSLNTRFVLELPALERN